MEMNLVQVMFSKAGSVGTLLLFSTISLGCTYIEGGMEKRERSSPLGGCCSLAAPLLSCFFTAATHILKKKTGRAILERSRKDLVPIRYQ